MANTNPIINLNVNGLNTPIKIYLKKERNCHRPSKNKTILYAIYKKCTLNTSYIYTKNK